MHNPWRECSSYRLAEMRQHRNLQISLNLEAHLRPAKAGLAIKVCRLPPGTKFSIMGSGHNRSLRQIWVTHSILSFLACPAGTKALVHALNLHPHVYCAEEHFHFRADHSRIIFPDTFLDASDGSDEEALKKIKHISNELARKGEITHAANKLPR